MSSLARRLVSKKKRRFTEGGFDLDLTYITDNIIAMGFPSEKVEGMFRNPMSEVVRFLDSRHGDHYKVYNLCSERSYDPIKFHGRVECYPFEDHNAPPIDLFRPFCNNVQSWLSADPKNVVVIHCKAGKGRTGVMISAYLMHSGLWPSADQALEFYGALRTHNKKGVTIPSQRRYVMYYERMLKERLEPKPRTLLLYAARMFTVPRFNAQNSSAPFFTIIIKESKVFTSKAVEGLSKDQTSIDLPVTRYIPLIGDVRVEFYHRKSGGHTKMFHFWFNTFFITDPDRRLFLRKEELDKANKDRSHKLFDESFAIEFRFIDPEEDSNVQPMFPIFDGNFSTGLNSRSLSSASSRPGSFATTSSAHDGTERNSNGTAVISVSSLNNVGEEEDLSDTEDEEGYDS